jgi:hypothetical protein
MNCHHEIDQGSKWSRDMRQQAWYFAHKNTVENLVSTKQRPVDLPVPDEAQFNFLSLW